MKVEAYVDGSYMKNMCGSGAVILIPNIDTPIKLSSCSADTNAVKLRNVAGEITAVVNVLKALEQLPVKIDELKIYYDYQGIDAWVTGKWRANNSFTQVYRDIVRQYQQKYRITFQKVKAHSGNKYNEMADMLAKEAIIGA